MTADRGDEEKRNKEGMSRDSLKLDCISCFRTMIKYYVFLKIAHLSFMHRSF